MSKKELKRTNKSGHPRTEFKVRLAKPRRGSQQPEATVRGVVDSGAMSNLWGLKDFLNSGFSQSDLISVKMD